SRKMITVLTLFLIDWHVIARTGLGIVSDLHQLTCCGVDETLRRFLPGTVGTDSRTVPTPLEKQRGDHDRPIHEQVEDEPGDDAGEREHGGANDRQHAV